MDTMDTKVKILQKMITTSKDELGDTTYHAASYSFMDFWEDSGLPKLAYIDVMKDLRHQGLIDIILHNPKEIESAVVKATKQGACFLADKSGNHKIGF